MAEQSKLDLEHTPKFGKPPVIETAIGVQFKPLTKMRVTDYGLLWQVLSPAGEFPIVEERNRLPREIEEQDDAGKQMLFQAWISHVQELQRVLFISAQSDDGQKLIQIQPDRFLQNWRRKSLNDENYPSYKKNRSEFETRYLQFINFAKTNELGDVVPDQCEVTHVNRIPVEAGVSRGDMLRNCFPALTNFGDFNLFKSEPEKIVAHWSYWIEPMNGRLRIDITPVMLKKDKQHVIDFRITARGTPFGIDADDILQWLDYGHYFVVNAFASITSPEMHIKWVKK